MNTSQSKEQTRFVKTPVPMLFHYTMLPKYKAEMTTLYGLILHYYNEKEGYAWPNVDTLAVYYGKNNKTTGEHLKVLEEYGLIRVEKDGNKKHFVPLQPLEETELYAKYPDGGRELERRLQSREDERKRSADNMARYRERARESDEELSTEDPGKSDVSKEIADLAEWF